MKHKYSLLIIFASLVFFECAHHYKVTYNIPDSIPDAQRKILVDKLDKGKELYKANCSQCHGIFTNGQDKIPNFTNAQFDNYSQRFLRRDPQNHAVALQMSMEQMNEVFAFLKYKRPKNPDSVKVNPRMR